MPALPTFDHPEDRPAKPKPLRGYLQTTYTTTKGEAHTVKDWEPECRDCGEQNPNFKPEVECKSCGREMGSIVTARELGETCPHCSKVGARVKQGVKFLACSNCKEPIASTEKEAKKVDHCPNCGPKQTEVRWIGG